MDLKKIAGCNFDSILIQEIINTTEKDEIALVANCLGFPRYNLVLGK